MIIIFFLLLFPLPIYCAIYERRITSLPELHSWQTIKNLYPNDPVINVHLVAHSHDDVGWLKTVDQYFSGLRNDIQPVSISQIIDDIVLNLLADRKRIFSFVEIAFFERWYRQQNEDRKQIMRDLVKNGQFVFLNGGACMNDEATANYRAIIDQMTRGHLFILKEFGEEALPTIGWHIDPFGHSSSQASLFSMMGFDGFFFSRIDYQDHGFRLQNKTMEFIWQGSETLGKSSSIFTGVLYDGYGPPFSFCYDTIHCGRGVDPRIQDDPNLFDYNVEERATLFSMLVHDEAQHFLGDIMLTMGEDFCYETAGSWFQNMEKLMKHINANPEKYGLNVFYSTPAKYVKSKFASKIHWPSKSDDFFPYASATHAYWTGYFVSRPTLKRYGYEMSSFLNALWQLDFLTDGKSCIGKDPNLCTLDKLDDAVSILQHHDAITGTEKQHVADDYALRLSLGYTSAIPLAKKTFQFLFHLSDEENKMLAFCPRMNESECSVNSVLDRESWSAFFFYNPLATSLNNSILSIPINSSDVSLYNSKTEKVLFQLEQITEFDKFQLPTTNPLPYRLVFNIASFPAFSIQTFFLNIHPSLNKPLIPKSPYLNEDIILENQFLLLTFSSETNLLKRIFRKDFNISVNIEQDWFYYTSYNETDQPSGAYIFRPKSSNLQRICLEKPEITFSKGEISSFVKQKFSSWLTQTIRLNHMEKSIIIQYTVGPIPVNDGSGKEIITRFISDVQNDGIFYTDSIGRDMVQRKYNSRSSWPVEIAEPVAGNYYPINSAFFIEDDSRRLSLLVDRAQGGASLSKPYANGEFEIMVHRRLLADDHKGVEEALNEPGQDGNGLVMRGTHLLLLTHPSSGTVEQRVEEQKILSPIFPAFLKIGEVTPSEFSKTHVLQKQFIPSELPLNLQLLTLRLIDDFVLLRIAHVFGSNERVEQLAVPVVLDLQSLFFQKIDHVIEYGLTGNLPLSKIHRLPFDGTSNTLLNTLVHNKVTINPLEIRTYKVYFSHEKTSSNLSIIIIISIVVMVGICVFSIMRKKIFGSMNSDISETTKYAQVK